MSPCPHVPDGLHFCSTTGGRDKNRPGPECALGRAGLSIALSRSPSQGSPQGAALRRTPPRPRGGPAAHLVRLPQGGPEGGGALRQEPAAQGAAEGSEGERAGAGEQVSGPPLRLAPAGGGGAGRDGGPAPQAQGQAGPGRSPAAGLLRALSKLHFQSSFPDAVGRGWGAASTEHSPGKTRARPGGPQPRCGPRSPPQSSLLPPHRLRAGLCDRCSVTQELARKKQAEFESSLVQSLRHVFVLSEPCASPSPPVGAVTPGPARLTWGLRERGEGRAAVGRAPHTPIRRRMAPACPSHVSRLAGGVPAAPEPRLPSPHNGVLPVPPNDATSQGQASGGSPATPHGPWLALSSQPHPSDSERLGAPGAGQGRRLPQGGRSPRLRPSLSSASCS